MTRLERAKRLRRWTWRALERAEAGDQRAWLDVCRCNQMADEAYTKLSVQDACAYVAWVKAEGMWPKPAPKRRRRVSR